MAVKSEKELAAKRPLAWLLGKMRRTTLRMRLIIAFLALILSSASATIAIGNAVFGKKVDELASSKVEVYLRVAEQIFWGRLEHKRLLAEATSFRVDMNNKLKIAPDFLELLIKENARIDFIIVSHGNSSNLIRFKGVYADSAPPDTDEKFLFNQTFLEGTPLSKASEALFKLAQKALKDGAPAASVALLPAKEMEFLGYAKPLAEGLFMAAAAPLPGNGMLVLAAMLNGKTELVVDMLNQISHRFKKRSAASIFMGSERIATTLDEQLWGSHAAAEVVQKVLGKGEPYIGIAKVVKENFYTAYSPISDFSGRRLGILGIGIEEKVYAEVKSQTLTLFSSLIAGGMIFGFIMSFWFAAWLVRPVRQLAEAIDKVAQGDLSYKVSISSADELGRLARSFNMMVRAVKERDLKLREITEERLSMVEKQVSIGRLAAGVAHEINNPLTSILSLSSLMLKHTPNEDEKKEDLKIIVAETTRCRDIVRSLLDFARERPMKKQPVEINQIVKDTLALTTKYESMDRASVHAELSEKTLLVNADPKQLQQVFTNIIINAAEALDKDGTITISTDEDTTGGFVILKVKDSGKGIPKEHIKRIFEPFFTTKGTGKGTGLGLSVSFGIIQKHEGAIEIESEEGKGTTVIITLPRWNANA